MQFINLASVFSSPFFAATTRGRWHPGIGDPTPMGWITTLCYLLAGLLCLHAAWQTYRYPPLRLGRRAVFFWGACGIVMLFLCINKQLDLQTLFTQIGRNWAKSDGWYQSRHIVQEWFIEGMVVLGLMGIAFTAWFIRGAPRAYYLTVVGLVFTGCFVVIRAASFHKVDALLGYHFAGIKINWLLELGGIGIVTAGVLLSREKRKVVETRNKDDDIPEIIVL